MALRYWVGGTGTWNTTSTLNWSTASGGSGGASVPTRDDYVIFDANSGSGTVTLDRYFAYLECSGLKKTTSNITLAEIDSGTPGIIIRPNPSNTVDNKVLDCTVPIGGNFAIAINSDSFSAGGSYTVLANGINTSYLQIGTNDTPTCSYSFLGDLNFGGMAFFGGNFTTNSFNLTTTSNNLSLNNQTGATFNLGSSVLTSLNHTVSLNMSVASGTYYISNSVIARNFQLFAQISTLVYSGTANITNSVEIGYGATFTGTINITGSNSYFTANQGSPNLAGTVNMTGSPATATIGQVSNSLDLLMSGTDNTIATNGLTASIGTLRFNNTSGNYLINDSISVQNLIANGSTPGSMKIYANSPAKVLNLPNTYTLSNISWQNITGDGVIPITGTGFVDLGGNTNIQFYVHRQSLFFAPNF